MKKTLKFLVSFLLAATMLFAVSALADTIELNNTVSGQVYSIYKMFDLKVDDENNPTSYSYTVNSAWEPFFTGTGAGAAYVTITNGYVTDISDPAELAKAAENWAGKPLAKETIEATGTTVTFNGLDHGYWLITSTLGSAAMAYTTPTQSTVTTREKNREDSVEKVIVEDDDEKESNDAQIGDTINYKVTITLEPNTTKVVFKDTLTSGLTYNNELQTVEGQYTVTSAVDTDGVTTITITFNNDYLAKLDRSTDVVLEYSATLNEKAIDVNNTAPIDQVNTAELTYGDKPTITSDTTTTYTYKFSVFKHASNESTNLAGAVFKLKDGNGTDAKTIQLIKLDDNNYRVAKTGEEGAVETFTTVADGDIVIWGVDAKTYYLEETEAPSGYNKLTELVEVVPDSSNALQAAVENNKGSALPSTGGIGTTIFYVLGTILVLAAVVLLITRRRMAK